MGYKRPGNTLVIAGAGAVVLVGAGAGYFFYSRSKSSGDSLDSFGGGDLPAEQTPAAPPITEQPPAAPPAPVPEQPPAAPPVPEPAPPAPEPAATPPAPEAPVKLTSGLAQLMFRKYILKVNQHTTKKSPHFSQKVEQSKNSKFPKKMSRK